MRLVNDFGLTNVKLHGEVAPLLDVFGFAGGDNSFSNLSIVEGALENGHQAQDQLRNIRGWLHAYQGVKARIYGIEAEMKEQYANLVAKGEGEETLARDESRNLSAAADNYTAAF